MEEFSISGKIVDVVNRRIYPGIIHIAGGKIVAIIEDPAIDGPFILPGLIDAHVHIESSMIIPSEFARLAVIHGTVGTVSDPHEIANVLGIDGVKFMIENGNKVPFKFNFGAPSCVPATPFETAGASFGLAETEELLKMDEIRYLSEMMNFPGVLGNDPLVMGKLKLAQKYGKRVDGHAPGLKGDDVKKYAAAGITTDHECFTLEEAHDKISAGMNILIREGSAARNFDVLIPLLSTYPEKIMFCSDDKHPDELMHSHINDLVRRALALGYDFFDVIRCCTVNPVSHYKLEIGLLQPGDPADFILVSKLDDFIPEATYINGIKVSEGGESLIEPVLTSTPNNFHARRVTAGEFRIPFTKGRIKVQIAHEGQLVTSSLITEPYIVNGFIESDTQRDILKMIVMNRYAPSAPALGFVQNFGLKRGAIASTVAHDSHNIIAIGVNDEDLAAAVNLLVEAKGGIACVCDGESTMMSLPVAGIMSDQNAWDVAGLYALLDQKAKSLGSNLRAPFMTLSFMALLVIPAIKLSDNGLFDSINYKFTSVYDVKEI